mmetsp:Transcript_88889/g.157459  ORF Transcript_88889/g.157459 Transcript_88889/m.157459 type:complete len:105 (-) Transcript_88889:149-463(-)
MRSSTGQPQDVMACKLSARIQESAGTCVSDVVLNWGSMFTNSSPEYQLQLMNSPKKCKCQLGTCISDIIIDHESGQCFREFNSKGFATCELSEVQDSAGSLRLR